MGFFFLCKIMPGSVNFEILRSNKTKKNPHVYIMYNVICAKPHPNTHTDFISNLKV